MQQTQSPKAGERTLMPSQSEMDHAAEAMTPADFNEWMDECAEQVEAANPNGQECDRCGATSARDDMTWHEDWQEHLCPTCERLIEPSDEALEAEEEALR